MAYVPPPPNSTALGQPTPEGVPKQDVHITDLPPEVRKSFLISMVFFPSLIGAAICALMFLGWVTIFRPKEATQYAQELGSSDMRRRWTAAREMGEHITQYGEEKFTRIYGPETLTALLEILKNPDLDKEVDEWTPSNSLRAEQEKGSLRAWAALMTGHIGGVSKVKADRERAYRGLIAALNEKEVALFAARGLSLLRDARAVDALATKLDPAVDPGARWAAAEALGSIGWFEMQEPTAGDPEIVRNHLRLAYRAENSRTQPDRFMLDNLAISLARLKDSEGRPLLNTLEKDHDPVVREQARRAIEILEMPLEKIEKK
jgi:hypothetical protein